MSFLCPVKLKQGSARLEKWIVAPNSSVVEDSEIAIVHYKVDGSDRPRVERIRSPISGVLVDCMKESNPGEYNLSGEEVLANLKMCSHSALMDTLCISCGISTKSIPHSTKKFWQKSLSERKSSSGSDTSVSGSHFHTVKGQYGVELSIHKHDLEQRDRATQENLRAQRKLILVLDLDHTLIHTTNNPSAVEIQQSVEFGNDICVWNDGVCDYYIKRRPWLTEFLDAASELFELHIDTAGTRPYAEAVASFIDPHSKLFGNNIVSRSDTDSKQKHVQWMHRAALDTTMVLILDDTPSVWKSNEQGSSLVAVEPYHFWTFPGDVNNRAGRSMIETSIPGEGNSLDVLNSKSGFGVHFGGHSASSLPRGRASLRSSRPDLIAPHLPRYFSEETEPILKDIFEFLKGIHREYFEQWDKRQQVILSNSSTSSIDSASGAKESVASQVIHIPPIPSVHDILRESMSRILKDVCVLFSGVFPLNMEKSQTNLYKRITQFGGFIASSLDDERCENQPLRDWEVAAGADELLRGVNSDDFSALASYTDSLSQTLNQSNVTSLSTGEQGRITTDCDDSASFTIGELIEQPEGSAVALNVTADSRAEEIDGGRDRSDVDDEVQKVSNRMEALYHEIHRSSTHLQTFNGQIVTHLVVGPTGLHSEKWNAAMKCQDVLVCPLFWLEESIIRYRRISERDPLVLRVLNEMMGVSVEVDSPSITARPEDNEGPFYTTAITPESPEDSTNIVRDGAAHVREESLRQSPAFALASRSVQMKVLKLRKLRALMLHERVLQAALDRVATQLEEAEARAHLKQKEAAMVELERLGDGGDVFDGFAGLLNVDARGSKVVAVDRSLLSSIRMRDNASKHKSGDDGKEGDLEGENEVERYRDSDSARDSDIESLNGFNRNSDDEPLHSHVDDSRLGDKRPRDDGDDESESDRDFFAKLLRSG